MDKDFDRYARTNHDRRQHIEHMPPLRQAFIEWIAEIKANKFITICFDRQMAPEIAEQYLERWFRRLHQKLYRKSPEQSGSNYLEMHGCCEYGFDKTIHYHIVARVPESYCDEFDLKAEAAWKSVLLRSRIYVEDHGCSMEDYFKVSRYITKSVNFSQWWRPHSRPQSFH